MADRREETEARAFEAEPEPVALVDELPADRAELELLARRARR